jgi:hypothetical protein
VGRECGELRERLGHRHVYKTARSVAILKVLPNNTEMVPRKSTANKVQFRSDTRIGNIAAEHDDSFLFECFIDNPAVAAVADLEAPGMILSGRTGSGKTAILRYIARSNPKSAEIDPADLSIQYISNSDVFQFLNDIGADLDMFFQTIWKHVLCVSYIRLRYQVDDKAKYENVIARLLENFSKDPTKRQALEYLQKWGNEFWVSIDENVRVISQRYEDELKAELGVDIQAMKSKAGYGRNLSRDQKIEYARRARKIIDGRQLADLSKVLDLFAGQEKSIQQKYYLLIDKLDERWADDSIKFRLIRALIETLKSFKKVKNLKIIVALRTDVIERSVQESRDAGFQREKFQDFVVEIKWKSADLKSLINKRINRLFLWRYTSQNVTFEDIFTPKIPPNRDTFEYMVERTHMRPRDIMAFVNKCLEVAEGSTEVSAKQLQRAEEAYSAERYNALLDEWRTSFPTLRHASDFLAGGRPSIQLDTIPLRELMERIALPICAAAELESDPLFAYAKEVVEAKYENPTSIRSFMKMVLALLYRTGVVGLKRAPEERYMYSFRDEATVSPTSLADTCKMRVHPMLHRALNVSDKGGATVD